MLVSGSPIPCLLNSAQFQMLLLQLLMTFTKQNWLFLFYMLYSYGHFNTLIRGEEEAPETNQVRAVLCRRVLLRYDCHSPLFTLLTPRSACVRLFLYGSIAGADRAVQTPALHTLLRSPR